MVSIKLHAVLQHLRKCTQLQCPAAHKDRIRLRCRQQHLHCCGKHHLCIRLIMLRHHWELRLQRRQLLGVQRPRRLHHCHLHQQQLQPERLRDGTYPKCGLEKVGDYGMLGLP